MALRIDYFFKETMTGLKRNGLVAFATVSTVFIALFLFGSALLVRDQSGLLIEQVAGNVEVSVFLTDGISPSQRLHLQDLLEQMPEVASVTFESKEQAYERFKRLFADQVDLVKNTSPDALPASFRVKLHDTEQFEVVKARLEGQPGIDTIQDHGDFLRRMNAVTNVLERGVFLVAIVLLIAAAVLIGNTVRMAVNARSREIGIMRLVGATNWFIRVPFLIEGVLQGLVGATIAVLGLFVMKGVIIESVKAQIPFLPFIATSDLFPKIPVMVVVGVAVSVLASLLAMRRPLEV